VSAILIAHKKPVESVDLKKADVHPSHRLDDGCKISSRKMPWDTLEMSTSGPLPTSVEAPLPHHALIRDRVALVRKQIAAVLWPTILMAVKAGTLVRSCVATTSPGR
jgi:hypothetical protein